MTSKHYEKIIYLQLHDEQTHKKLEGNIDSKIERQAIKLANQYKDNFTDLEYKYLTRFVSTTSEFSGLPKIHKYKILEQETKSQNNEVIDCYEPEDLKLRPIIPGTSCPTRSLSDIIDKILKPLLKHVKSYIKDSIHFLNKSKRTVKSGTIIVTFDVSSL